MGRGLSGDEGHGPVALVADSSATDRVALARALAEIGYRVICAATPLEMIHHLEHRDDLDLIVLGANLGRYDGDELAAFLAEAHPQLRRVFVARRAWGARSAAKAIFGSVLEKPWSEDLVRSALTPELDESTRDDGGDVQGLKG